MSEIYLHNLGNSHASWLSARQTLIAGNVANANTPGFKALDVKAFDESDKGFSVLAQTQKGHLSSSSGGVGGFSSQSQTPWETYHSGGNVSVAQEMMKAGEVATAYELNTSVMKSFHRMVISVFGS